MIEPNIPYYHCPLFHNLSISFIICFFIHNIVHLYQKVNIFAKIMSLYLIFIFYLYKFISFMPFTWAVHILLSSQQALALVSKIFLKYASGRAIALPLFSHLSIVTANMCINILSGKTISLIVFSVSKSHIQ